jgi:hypothetical protein
MDKQVLKSGLRQAYGDVIYTLNEIPESAFYTRNQADKWSPGEIVGHLLLSTRPINKGLSIPLEKLKSIFGTIERPEMDINYLKEKYTDRLQAGLKAPNTFVWNVDRSQDKSIMSQLFIKELNQLIQHIDQWSMDDLSLYQMPHPAIGNLNMNEMIYFTEIHTRHHHEQIKAYVSA